MKNWETLLVRPDTLIEEAIDILNRGAQQIVLVVDEQRHLLGTMTDGDVRRALLKHIPLDSPVSRIMCETPKKAHQDWSNERILAAIEQYQLLQLPVVNDAGELVALQTLHGLLKKKHLDNPVLLVAGGFGTRLHPLTKNCPKPLLKLADKPILELIIERLIEKGFHRFFISTHYLSDQIQTYFEDGSQWGVSIQYLDEEEPLGTGGALGLLPHDEINLPILMMNADLLTDLNFQNVLDFHHQHDGIATVCVREYQHQVPFGVLEVKDQQVISLKEKPVYRAFINAGIYLISQEVARSVGSRIRIDMPDIIQHHIDKGHRVNIFPIHEYWLDIGQMENFRQAEAEIHRLEV